MVKKIKTYFRGSIEDASILRKFTILFILMSLLPTIVLYYFYIQIRDTGAIEIAEQDFYVTLLFIIAGVVVGFFSMRSLLVKVIKLTKSNQKILEGLLSPAKVSELGKEKNEIAILAQSFTEITNRLEENVRSLELAKRTLHSVMSKVGQGISSMDNIDTFLELILETASDALNGKVGVLMLVDPKKSRVKLKTVYGMVYDINSKQKIRVQEGTIIDQVIKSKEPIIIHEVPKNILDTKQHDALFEPPIICAPLIFKDKVKGIISINGRTIPAKYTDDEKVLLMNIAHQTAIAIENSKLDKDIEQTYFETISALALAVDAKDKYSRGHLDRVAKYSVKIGKELGLDENDLKTLRDSARLHDLGKIGIPDEILKKPGPLTDDEKRLMQSHVEIGESIVKPIQSLNHLSDIIRHHHEWLNGAGYPDGLKGDEISPLVRILTVADIYDALTTDRPYRKKHTRQEAFSILREMKLEIDQDIVSVFQESL